MGDLCETLKHAGRDVLIYRRFTREGIFNMAQGKNLTPAEDDALREIARPSLIKKPIPAKVQDRLIKMGFVEQKFWRSCGDCERQGLFSSSGETAKKDTAPA
jgi:hypothetical protein